MKIINLSDVECIICKHCGSKTLPTGYLSYENLHAYACIKGCVPIQFSSQEPGLYFYKNQLYPLPTAKTWEIYLDLFSTH